MSRAASTGRATFGIAGTGRVYTSPRMMKIKLDTRSRRIYKTRVARESTATERRLGTTVFLARSSAPGGHVRAGPPGRLGCVVVAVRFGEDD